MSSKNRILLSVMMFLQFFVWGAWFATLGACLASNNLASIIGDAYGSAPLAAIIAPLLLGLVADRFFNSEKAMGVLHLIGGGLLFMAPGLVAKGDGKSLVWLFTAYMLCYMPTLGLSNTVAFTNIDDRNKFPALRVWGTIGWIVAGLIVGGLGWSASTHIFTLAAVSSLVLGVVCFLQPATPPPAAGKPINLQALLMVDAFKMLANVPFLVFIVCSPSWIGDVSQLIGIQALCTAVLFIEGITQPRTTAFMNIVESAEEICIFAFVAIGFSATGS